jgi:hypothetical protein
MVKELCGLSSSRSKVIGPSVQDIASIYKAKNGNIAFLVEDAAPIVDRVNMSDENKFCNYKSHVSRGIKRFRSLYL